MQTVKYKAIGGKSKCVDNQYISTFDNLDSALDYIGELIIDEKFLYGDWEIQQIITFDDVDLVLWKLENKGWSNEW